MIWSDLASCKDMDTDLWFSRSQDAVAFAKRVCAGCPVKEECLQAALDVPGTRGIWGGHTENMRSRLRHKDTPKGVAAAAAAQTHCVNSHPFTTENTHVNTRGERVCRACANERSRRWREKQKETAA